MEQLHHSRLQCMELQEGCQAPGSLLLLSAPCGAASYSTLRGLLNTQVSLCSRPHLHVAYLILFPAGKQEMD